MSIAFDPGYGAQPFRGLVEQFPGPSVYLPSDWRVEWGPVFHRGRLDGSAKVLLIGQDPAQHEEIVRRCLVGEAGHRIQGFLAKLGIDHSYVFVNTYLYSVYGSIKAKYKTDPQVRAYRHQWLNALVTAPVRAVVALGGQADDAWQAWKATPAGAAANVTYVKITHPTFPDSAAGHGTTTKAEAMKTMLQNWNAGLQALSAVITNPDQPRPLVLYGNDIQPGKRSPIPTRDLPAGTPAWMGVEDGWAKRVGGTAQKKRGNITLNVPGSSLP